MANEAITPISNREKLYNNLIGTGKVSEAEIGTKDDFVNSVTDVAGAKHLYQNLKSRFDEEEIGDEGKFLTFITPDFSGPLPAGQGNIPLPSNPAQAPVFTNPLVVEDKAPAPLKSKASGPDTMQDTSPADEQQLSIDALPLPDRKKELDAQAQKILEENEWLTRFEQIEGRIKGVEQAKPTAKGELSPTSLFYLMNKAKVNKEDREFYDTHLDKAEEARRRMNAVKMQKDFIQIAENLESYDPKGSKIKQFWQGLVNTGTMKDFATMGITQIERAFNIGHLLRKASENEDLLLPEEKQAVDTYNNLRKIESEDRGFWHKSGAMFQQMVPFVAQMMLTSGATNAVKAGLWATGKAATFKAAKEIGKKEAVNYAVRKGGQEVVANMLRSPLTTTMYTNLAERRLQNYSENEEGKVVRNDNTLAGDVYKAYVTNTLEYLTEGFGELAGRGLLTPFINNKKLLGVLGKQANILDKITGNPVYKKMGGFLDKAQVHNISSEIFLEEVPNALLSSLLTGSDDYKQLADPEFYGSIALNTALLGGTFTGIKLASGGVANNIEKNRISNQAKSSLSNFASSIATIGDEKVRIAAENLQASIQNSEYFNPDNKSEGPVFAAMQNLKEVIGTDSQSYEDVISAASKAAMDNAVKTGAYQGIEALAESEMGGPVFHKRIPNSVVIGVNREDKQFYITDTLESELDKELMVVRDVETGEVSTVTSGEFVDVQMIDKKSWLDSWLQSRETLKPVQDAVTAENAAMQQVEQQEMANEQPISMEEIEPGKQFRIGEEKVTVIDATEEDIFVVDKEGNEHRVELGALERVPSITPATEQSIAPDQTGSVEQPQEVDAPLTSEISAETPASVETPSTEIVSEQISFPVDKEGQIDYAQITEPKMYAEALKSEFGEEAPEMLDDLLAEQKEALKKAQKATNPIERRRKVKAINTEMAKLNEIRGFIIPQQSQSEAAEAPMSAPMVPPVTKQPGKRPKLTPFQQELQSFESPQSKEEAVAFALLEGGLRLKLKDSPGTKGFAKHLGLKVNSTDMRRYFGLQNEKVGLTPEKFAHYLKENDTYSMFQNMDEMEVLDVVLDVMGKVYSKRAALDFIKDSREGVIKAESNLAERPDLTSEEIDYIVDDYFAENYLSLSQEESSLIDNVFISAAQQEEYDRLLNSEDLPEDTNQLNTLQNDTGRDITAGNDRGEIRSDASEGIAESNQGEDGVSGGVDTGDTGRGLQDEASSENPDLVQQRGVTGEQPVQESIQSVEPELSPVKKSAIDKINTSYADKIKELESKKKEILSAKERKFASLDKRNGLFGDTNPEFDNNPLAGEFVYNEEVVAAALRPFDEQLAQIGKEIESAESKRAADIEDTKNQIDLFEENLAIEEAKVDVNASDKQKEAGNYQKGHIQVQGFNVSIENPRGSTRSGTDRDGKKWEITMNNTYGYILGTTGKDADHIDVFLGDNPVAENIFVVDQVNPDGLFDEHKVMLGFDDIESAKAAYQSNYKEGWQGLGNITAISVEGFREWAENGTRRIKPFADYRQVQSEQATTEEAPVQEASQPEASIQEQPSSTQKIEDFGEKILGAKKDLRAGLKEQASREMSDVLKEGFAKVFPLQDYAKLVELGITTPEEAALLQYMRSNIGARPSGRYPSKINKWMMSVRAYKDVLDWLSDKQSFADQHDGMSFMELMRTHLHKLAVEEIDNYIKTLLALGFPESKVNLGSYSIRRFIGRSTYTIVNGSRIINDYKTFDEAVAGLKYIISSLQEKQAGVKFDMWYMKNNPKNIIIGKKVAAGKFITLKDGFASSKEASEYIEQNREQLEKMLEEAKIVPQERPDGNKPRIGFDYRNGKDATPEMYQEAFGFRGVQFGNYVEQSKRQDDLNEAYDALFDLAKVLNIPTKAISLNGELGLAFGARGSGGKDAPLAHYEAGQVVINLTKNKGAGSLAHEWFHALDNYFERMRGRSSQMITEGYARPQRQADGDVNTIVRDEVLEAFKNVVKSINNSALKSRSDKLDEARSKPYWGTIVEMAARSFESYVYRKLAEDEIRNDYLVAFRKIGEYINQAGASEEKYPYPTNEEAKTIDAAFEGLFQTIKTKTEGDNTLLYREQYFYSPTEQALNVIKQEKGTPEQWKAMLLKNGAKEAEMDWMGWEDFVDEKKSLTRADIQEWIDLNRIEVQEVEKGVKNLEFKTKDVKSVERDTRPEFANNWFVKIGRNDIQVRAENDVEAVQLALQKANKFKENSTRYSQYQLPGGENYKELLLTMPAVEESWKNIDDFKQAMRDKYGEGWKPKMSKKESNAFESLLNGETKRPQQVFASSHFYESNILAHIRFNERITPSGDRILFIEEIQSDWAQQGKKKGFNPNEKAAKAKLEKRIAKIDAELLRLTEQAQKEGLREGASTTEWREFENGNQLTPEIYRLEQAIMTVRNNREYDSINAEIEAIKEKQRKIGAEKLALINDRKAAESELRELNFVNSSGVPDMPFKTTDQWVNLALRRALIYAAENGFDRVAWTNGEMQAKRYDLSKYIDSVKYKKNQDDTYGVYVFANDGSHPLDNDSMTISEVENTLGKEIAQKISDGEGSESGPFLVLWPKDMKFGGEGMKAFYDNIIPAQVNKIGKKFGAKVETTSIPVIDKEVYDHDTEEVTLTPEAEEMYQKFMDSVAEEDGSYSVEQFVADMKSVGYEVQIKEDGEPNNIKKIYNGETYSVQSIPITPAIREQAAIGMPLFKENKPFAERSVSELANEAQEFAKSLGVKVNILADSSEFPSLSPQRKARGWYSPVRDEITIILANHESMKDLQATILHEAVGHKGLRYILGDSFNSTMEKVFDSLPRETRADYYARYAKKVLAAEEYMSNLAEESIEPSLWEKIKGFIRDAFRSIGVNLILTDSDLAYMLWRSKNRLQNIETATSAEVMRDISFAEFAKARIKGWGEVLFRSKDSNGDLFVLDTNSITLTKGEKFIEAMQDRMISGSKLIAEVKKRGGKVGTFSNFVSEETRSSSRAKAELDDFEDNYFKPLLSFVEKWVKAGKSLKEIELYMMAKHAPERNRFIVKRQARETILTNYEYDLKRAENKRKKATTEAVIEGIDKTIENIQAQINFIKNEENASLVSSLVENAYDVAFFGEGKMAIPDYLDTFSYLLALNYQKKVISSLENTYRSEEGNNRSGMTDENANSIVDEFEKSIGDTAEISKFWKAVNKATHFSLEKSRKYGLISTDVYNATKGIYNYYVPLRSWAEKENIDYQDVFGENYLGKEILNSVNKHSKGRTSLADNPLGFIASMAESSVVAGSKNEVRKNAWRLIKNNSDMNDLFLIKQAWEVNIADQGDEPMWEVTFEPPTQEMLDLGLARALPPNDAYNWHKSRGELDMHQVPVFIDGNRVLMEFKGPIGVRVAAAINGENVVRWKNTDGIARFTRIMAALKTSKNPDFMLTNFIRDFFFGNMAYANRGGNPLKLTKNLNRAWIAIHKDFTKGKEDSYLKSMYEDFKMNGGETGYVHMLGEQNYKKKIEKMVKEANQASKISPTVFAKKTFKVLNHGLDYLAHMSENAMRFATYLTEVESLMEGEGATKPTEAMKKQAALAAKDVTTNFNRKGKWSSQINSFYAFFNASVQGSANYIKLAKENPARFITANLALMSIRTLLTAWCLSLIGGDDDDSYEALSDYIKENNFVIPDGGGKFITIPLPHGSRALTNFGPLALEVMAGKKDIGKALDTYTKNMISELSPINLVGLDKSAFIPRNAGEALLTALPTAIRPFAETALNLDFMGRSIERKNFIVTGDGYVPRFMNAYANTNPILIGMSRQINKWWGGNDSRSAAVQVSDNGDVSRSVVGELFDISPAYTEHILEGYFGGLGRFVNDLYKTGRSIVKGETPEMQNIPVFRRLYQEPYENKAWQSYFETRTRVNDIERAIKSAKDEKLTEEYVKLNNYYNISLISTFGTYNDIIKKISENIKTLPSSDPRRKQAEKSMDDLVERMHEEIKAIDKLHNKK